jgi:uncharacterized protein (DUF1015 family)
MVSIRAFRAVRPDPSQADRIVSVPYDVLDRDEARAMADGNPVSFLRVVRSDLEFPDSVGPYDDQIYARAKENLEKFIADGNLVRESEDCLYIYRLNRGDHQQTGLVTVSAIDDYLNDIIKKHEFTRPEKEKDRTTHIDRLSANTGPVFLLYRSAEQAEIAKIMDGHADANTPLYDVSFDDGVRHRVYPVAKGDLQKQLLDLFAKLKATYIADGHHRAASANSIGRKRRESAGGSVTGEELFNFFLTVIFPDDQMAILPYNRAVKDLNGLSPRDFLKRVEENFSVRAGEKIENPGVHELNMYLTDGKGGGEWYALRAAEATYAGADEINSLDVSVLQNHLLAPVLDIADPRTSDRIIFVGGIRGDGELERLVKGGKFAVAFAMPPVTTGQLLDVADAGKVMPPKSTWFEPKLRSGFLVHRF